MVLTLRIELRSGAYKATVITIILCQRMAVATRLELVRVVNSADQQSAAIPLGDTTTITTRHTEGREVKFLKKNLINLFPLVRLR